MQKKIIALAVAGLVSGVAFAQTNVTVYGVIDQGYLYSKTDNGLTGANSGDYKFSGLKDGGLQGSRFGFKGEEALGNGLKAIFTMEYGKDSDNDTGVANIYTRQVWVGVNSAYGTATAGRQYNAASDVYGANNVNGVTGVYPLNLLQGAAGQQLRSQGGNARQDNVLKYVSPNWSGFTAEGSYAFGETNRTTSANWDPKAETTDNGRWSLALNYANGPLNVSGAYAQTNSVRTAAVASPDLQGNNIDEWYIGGSYDFKVVKVAASYQTLDNGNKATTTVTDTKLWALGGSGPVGAKGKVMVEYAQIDADTDHAVVNQNGSAGGWGLGYQHDLSKRTALYTAISQIDYDNNFAAGAMNAGVGTSAIGQKQLNFNMGVRHAF